jgi:hypothetical protein
MSESDFLAALKQCRLMRGVAFILLLVGVMGCIGSLYLTTMERAPNWPLICIGIACGLFLISQIRIERHET